MADKPLDRLTGPALWTGIVVVAAWLIMVILLALHIGDQEVQWSRLVFLLGSIEAVAFAAAGALFGTQIQRQRVTDAKERADKAEKEATSNKDAAVKGRGSAAVVKAESRSTGHTQGITRTSAEGVPAASASLQLAEELFPDEPAA